MYSRQQASQLRQLFWTAFGRYMAPVPGATGEKVNWINYKTGVKYISFKMEATQGIATISIELLHANAGERLAVFQQFEMIKPLFLSVMQEDWDWQKSLVNEHGQENAVISKSITGVNIFSNDCWPEIISFFKQRIIRLDAFWFQVKPLFE